MSLTQEAWKKLQAEYDRTSRRADNIDYKGVIQVRKSELYDMAGARKRPSAILEMYDHETREIIMRYGAMSSDEFESQTRRTWTRTDLFKYAARMVLVFAKACVRRRRYAEDRMEKTGLTLGKNRAKPGGASRSSLGKGMVVALTTRPEVRTQKHIRKIGWILRTTKAFRQLFPPDREAECARYLGYCKYDDGRLMAKQDCKPDWFYYVLAGKVIKLRQYELSSGVINKPMGYLMKGMTSEPEEIENQTPREFTLVAKGHVEVLLLHKTIYHKLQSLGEGPPISYLSSLELFEEFPIQRIVEHPECVEMKYYGDGKVIVKDTNRTPWIHIVKSGVIKVVRRQMVLNSVPDIFSQPHDDQLGCIKPPSHARAMLGINHRQRQNKLKSGESSSLPRVSNKRRLLNGGTHESSSLDKREPSSISFKDDDEEVVKRDDTTLGPRQITVIQEDDDESMHGAVQWNESARPPSPTRQEMASLPPLVRIPSREPSLILEERRDFLPHRFYLTREKTDASSLRTRRDVEERRTYVELGTLGPGDVFGDIDVTDFLDSDNKEEGLEHMEKTMASEPQGFSLLSDGVEVVKISKRFFLQFAANNTMLKLETLSQQYMNDDEAKESLHDLRLWEQYKASLIQRMTERLLDRRSDTKKNSKKFPSRFEAHSVKNKNYFLPTSQSARF